MAEPDWRDLTAAHEVSVQMVSQTNFGDTWGELEGVDLSNSSLDAGYYTDERTSGTLSVIGEGWRRGSFVRIVHSVPKYGWRQVMGTYIVTADPAEYANGVWRYELELHSTLRMLAGDKLTRPWTIAKGASALTCMKQVLAGSGAHSMRRNLGSFGGAADATVEIDTSLAEDKQATTAQVMAAGKSRLECMYALASMSNNRLDVHPDGWITVSRRVNPASKHPKWRIDLADPRGIVVEGSLSRTSDWLSMPDTVAVQHDYTDKSGSKSEQKSVYGTATMASTAHNSVARRGYSVVDFRSVPDLTPHTAQAAQQKAQQILKEQSLELVEWELTTTFLPLWEGDVVELVVHDGLAEYRGTRKCLVKSVSVALDTMLMQLTLKETAAGDKGDE